MHPGARYIDDDAFAAPSDDYIAPPRQNYPPTPPPYHNSYPPPPIAIPPVSPYGSPMPPPPPPPQPTIIHINANGVQPPQPTGVYCQVCHKQTPNLVHFEAGRATWLWCLALTFVGLCCVPFLTKNCDDTTIRCGRCRSQKSVVRAKCL